MVVAVPRGGGGAALWRQREPEGSNRFTLFHGPPLSAPPPAWAPESSLVWLGRPRPNHLGGCGASGKGEGGKGGGGDLRVRRVVLSFGGQFWSGVELRAGHSLSLAEDVLQGLVSGSPPSQTWGCWRDGRARASVNASVDVQAGMRAPECAAHQEPAPMGWGRTWERVSMHMGMCVLRPKRWDGAVSALWGGQGGCGRQEGWAAQREEGARASRRAQGRSSSNGLPSTRSHPWIPDFFFS